MRIHHTAHSPTRQGPRLTGTCLGSDPSRRGVGEAPGAADFVASSPPAPGGRAPSRRVTGAPTGREGDTDTRDRGDTGPGNRGWERTQGTEGPPLGVAPSRPATAARPYRDFLGVLFAVGGQHPGRGAPPCGLPQLVVTGRKAVFLRGEETLKRALYPSFPPSQKPSRHPPARRRAPWRGCGSCPSAGSPCRRGLPRRAGGSRCPPGRTRPAGPPHGPAATAAPAPRRDLRRAGGVEVPSGSRWVPSLPLFPIPYSPSPSPSPSSPACLAALARAIPLRIPVPGASRRGAAPRPLYRASGVCAAGAGGCWGAPPLAPSGPGCPPRAGPF